MFAFDIETYDRNTKISCASIVGKDLYGNIYQRYFENSNGRSIRDEFIKEIKTNIIFKNSVIFATNLGFDFMGMFFNNEEMKHFDPRRNGGKLLAMKTHITPLNEFSFSGKPPYKTGKKYATLEFRDSKNYADLSLEKMGKVIGFEKLPTPDFITDIELWTKPRTVDEWNDLKQYNINDSWVTFYFMEYLFNGYEQLGATVKLTQASTSMSLFKNKFLGDYVVYPQRIDYLQNTLQAYYGGRTEAFKRGEFKNCFYYDFNSLYPSVMHDYEFPDPNFTRCHRRNKQDFIFEYEGVAEITIEVPKMASQPLPYKEGGKILFPCGTIKGWWAHIEIRNAVECGCTIKEVHQDIYFTKTVRPFKGFVSTLYNLRKKYKKEVPVNPMEYVTKILMNSLYGKFGEKFDDRTNTYHKDSVTKKMYDASLKTEFIDDFIDLTESQEPMAHCIPIWAVYTTAYGRVKLHKAMMQHPNIIYCDTDSMVTPDIIPTSDELGDLKVENNIEIGWVVRPKVYAFIDDDTKEERIKVKGLGHKIDVARFLDLEHNPKVSYKRVAQFKEAIRRGLFVPNETIPTHKTFGLEDSKRNWGEQVFSFTNFQESDPLEIQEGKIVSKMTPKTHRVANLKANKKPTINNGANSIGDVAPTMK